MRYYWLYFRWLLVMCVAKPLGVGALMTPWEALECAWQNKADLKAEYVITRPPCQCEDCVAIRAEELRLSEMAKNGGLQAYFDKIMEAQRDR